MKKTSKGKDTKKKMIVRLIITMMDDICDDIAETWVSEELIFCK